MSGLKCFAPPPGPPPFYPLPGLFKPRDEVGSDGTGSETPIRKKITALPGLGTLVLLGRSRRPGRGRAE